MIDWTKIVGFDWDAGNERKSSEKHGVNKVEAEQVFFNLPLIVLADRKHSGSESRYHALGMTEADRKLHISFTLRLDESLIRVISARDMHRKERASYEKS